MGVLFPRLYDIPFGEGLTYALLQVNQSNPIE